MAKGASKLQLVLSLVALTMLSLVSGQQDQALIDSFLEIVNKKVDLTGSTSGLAQLAKTALVEGKFGCPRDSTEKVNNCEQELQVPSDNSIKEACRYLLAKFECVKIPLQKCSTFSNITKIFEAQLKEPFTSMLRKADCIPEHISEDQVTLVSGSQSAGTVESIATGTIVIMIVLSIFVEMTTWALI